MGRDVREYLASWHEWDRSRKDLPLWNGIQAGLLCSLACGGREVKEGMR